MGHDIRQMFSHRFPEVNAVVIVLPDMTALVSGRASSGRFFAGREGRKRSRIADSRPVSRLPVTLSGFSVGGESIGRTFHRRAFHFHTASLLVRAVRECPGHRLPVSRTGAAGDASRQRASLTGKDPRREQQQPALSASSPRISSGRQSSLFSLT